MAVSIVSSQTISGDTFYRNNPFDISFSVTGVSVSDVSFYFGNSTPGLVPYTTDNRFRSTTGFPTTGSKGTLSVNVVMTDPGVVTTVGGFNSYFGTAGCALDSSGFIYVANTSRHTIVRIDPSTGIGEVWAGLDGSAGDTNGPRLTAEFRAPGSLTWDSSWNLYVTDNYRLRKIDSNGIVSTLAGGTTQGYVDSIVGSNAQFVTPSYPLPLSNGDILLPNPDAHVIRKVTQEGVVTTYAGGSGAGYADGSLASVVVSRKHLVRAGGISATVYDTSDLSGSWATSTSTAFSTVYAIHCDTSDINSNRILYGGDSNATYGGPLAYQTSTSASLVGATGLDVSFDRIQAIAYDPSTNVYVAGGYKGGSPRTNYGLVPYVSSNGGASWTAYTDANPTPNRLNECRTIAYGNGTWMAGGSGWIDASMVDTSASLLISTDASTWTATYAHNLESVNRIAYANGTWVVVGDLGTGGNIARSTDDGATWTSWQLSTSPANLLKILSSVAYGGGTWVVGFRDAGSLFGPAFAYSTDASTWSTATNPDGINGISNIIYSTTQNQFIASGRGIGGTYSNVFTSPDGITWTTGSNSVVDFLAMADVSEGSIQTTLGTAKFTYPRQLAMDSNNVMYLADGYNNRIRIFSNGQVGTYAGNGTETLVNGGNRLTSGIPRPIGIGFTADGSLYISSFDRNIVQRIGGDRVTTFAGTYGVAGYADGTPSNALFNGLTTFAVQGSDIYSAEVYNGDVRKFTRYPELNPILPRVPTNGTIIATSNYPITVNSRLDVCWTSVGGVLPLFKFEPFSNTITANRCGGTTTDTLTYAGITSTELLGYMSGTGTTTASFSGPNGASVAYPYSLTLAVRAISNSVVVDDVSTTVTIGTARIIYSPCNANLVFYRNEPSPAPVFSLVSSDAAQIYSATTLPTGLGFTRTGTRSFALTGTPSVQTITSNYTILGTDTSGRTYATQVSMVVNPERLIIDTEGSLAQSNLGIDAPIEPITFRSRFPPYGQERTMRYTWSPQPPAGIQFRDVYGNAISGSNYTVNFSYDPSFTLTLSGTITEDQLRTFALAGSNSYSVSLTGTRTFPTPSLSPSLPKTITFSFGETIFFDSNISTLYVGLQTQGSNYWYFAKTYFPRVDTSIQTIAVTDGFIPDGMVGSFNFTQQRFELSGTPISALPYSFTLTATDGSGVSASLPVSTTVRTDSVTVTSLTDACFNFIQYRSLSNGKEGFYTPPMRYVVTSESGCNATLTGTDLPTGVTLDLCGTNTYVLSGRPTVASGLTTATLTGTTAATGVSATKTFQYSVSAETFFFSDASFAFIQNVPITPVQIDVSTLSENSVIRFSSPSIPSALQVTNTGLVRGTVLGSNAGTFDVTAFTAYTSGSKTYSYTITPDQVLLEPTVYTTVTAPGGNVSIPINGYSLSAVTVSNYRFQSAFPYGLSINSTTGLLSGTLASSLPSSTTFTLLGSAGSVDGSLEGTMTTTNLTVNRAQILRNEWANFFPDVSTMYTYSSDDNGLTWTERFATHPDLYASTIGTNGSNVYLIPTSSNYVLKTTDTVTFTSNAYAASDVSAHATSIVNKPGTSTWWMVGTQATGATTRDTYLYTSSNDGLTWTSNAIVGATTRDKEIDVSGQWSPYLVGGAALAYKDGVLLFGGTQILRSTDEGQTWSTVGGGFTKEVGFFSLDHELVWIATGSDTYETLSNAAWTGATANTICYSLDQGLSWTYAANGFNMNGYGVVYGTGAWLAYGLCNASMQYRLDTLYSLDGVNWAQVSSISPVVGALGGTVRPGALHMTIAFDETDWKVLAPTSDTSLSIYSHPYDTPLTSGWTSVDVTAQFPGFGSNTEITSYTAELIDPGADITTITFPTPTTGPVFVSPAQTTYSVWQYMPLPPITFSAPGATAYFVSALPVGLTWNSLTQTITGACMRLGTQTFTVYAKNSGITAITITLLVNVPRVIRKQTSAGAYTALVRDYTEVNAAINARDTRVNPTEEAALGSFAAPYAPDVVTPSNCPC